MIAFVTDGQTNDGASSIRTPEGVLIIQDNDKTTDRPLATIALELSLFSSD